MELALSGRGPQQEGEVADGLLLSHRQAHVHNILWCQGPEVQVTLKKMGMLIRTRVAWNWSQTPNTHMAYWDS